MRPCVRGVMGAVAGAPAALPARAAASGSSQPHVAAGTRPSQRVRPALPLSRADSAFFGPAKQYVRWDTGLHEVFVAAVEELGGAHAGAPCVPWPYSRWLPASRSRCSCAHPCACRGCLQQNKQ